MIHGNPFLSVLILNPYSSSRAKKVCLTNIYGWKIRVTDKTVTFSLPDMNRGIRGNKLGEEYGKAELMERIDVATLNNIDGLVYPHKWEYLNYLEEIRYRRASTLTLQQVSEPILSFEEFNEMMERESVMPVESVGNVQDLFC